MTDSERIAQLGQVRPTTDTERLVARIDADIAKLQEWRAYVFGQSPVTQTETPKPKRGRKPKRAPGLPVQEPTA